MQFISLESLRTVCEWSTQPCLRNPDARLDATWTQGSRLCMCIAVHIAIVEKIAVQVVFGSLLGSFLAENAGMLLVLGVQHAWLAHLVNLHVCCCRFVILQGCCESEVVSEGARHAMLSECITMQQAHAMHLQAQTMWPLPGKASTSMHASVCQASSPRLQYVQPCGNRIVQTPVFLPV